MSLEAIFTGIAAVITAAAGMALVVREFRSREHKAARREIDQLVSDLYTIDEALIEQRRYTFTLRQLLADAGIDVPPAPQVKRLSEGAESELEDRRSKRVVRHERHDDVRDSGAAG